MKAGLTKNLHAIRSDLLTRLHAIKQEKAVIEADLEAVDRMLQRYEDQTKLPLQNGDGESKAVPLVGGEPVGDQVSLRDHILTVLRLNHPKAFRAKDLRILVTERGYKSTAQSFEGAMFAMLSNLNKNGKIEKAGTGLYRYRMPEEQK